MIRPIVNNLPRGLKIIIKKFLGRFGFYTPKEKLIEILPEDSIGVEIGVWKGASAQKFLKRLEPRELHLVDPWRFATERENSWYGGGRAQSQSDMDAIYESVAQKFSGYSNVYIHRKESQEAVEEFDDGELDWVYIDGDHAYEAVLHDLKKWIPKVCMGGLICGDDYSYEGWWGKGVKRAVNEILKEDKLIPLLIYENQFVLKKSEDFV